MQARLNIDAIPQLRAQSIAAYSRTIEATPLTCTVHSSIMKDHESN